MNNNPVQDRHKSPSLTPPNNSHKPSAAKKKPPVHNKQKPKEITNTKIFQSTKAPTPKKKSNKSRTNSITPKILKHTIYEKMFHNSNLSDTDISSK